MLQNKLKEQPPRGCTYMQGVIPSITLQEITSKYYHFGHVIGVSFTKMSISETFRKNTHLKIILPHSNHRALRS